jgi:hypothetical protein
VSVSVYDEEEQQRERLAQAQKEKEQVESALWCCLCVQLISIRQNDIKKRKAQQLDEAENKETGDVLTSYDPYNTNMYKGVFIGSNSSNAVDDSVSFPSVPRSYVHEELSLYNVGRTCFERRYCRFQETKALRQCSSS